ncbi:MAG: hypothetical protein A2173_08665 [Planctomycetes bacterium RBG_13_44_8b]|nr:MAG: hypothetical protein A2173_08665 [Planctomycetes bacterium RBG_13_44_8b]
MIEKINIGQIQDLSGKLTSKPQDSPKIPVNDNADASLQVDYTSIINRETQNLEADTEAIRKAQELLRSGKIESMENIKEAAENILKFGV